MKAIKVDQKVRVIVTDAGANTLNSFDIFGAVKAGDAYVGTLSDLVGFFGLCGTCEHQFVNDEIELLDPEDQNSLESGIIPC